MKKKFLKYLSVITIVIAFYYLLNIEFVPRDFGSIELKFVDENDNLVNDLYSISYIHSMFDENFFGIPILEKSEFPDKNLLENQTGSDGKIYINYYPIWFHLYEYYSMDNILINVRPKENNRSLLEFLSDFPYGEFNTVNDKYVRAIIFFNYSDKDSSFYMKNYNIRILSLKRNIDSHTKYKIVLSKDSIWVDEKF